MTLSRSHRRLSARAFLGVALLVVLVASWLPCTQAMAGGSVPMAHPDHHCGHCPDRDVSPDGVARAATLHCVDVAKGSPDSRATASPLPAFAFPLLAWRAAPKVRPPDVPGPAPVVLPRSRLHLEKSVLLI